MSTVLGIDFGGTKIDIARYEIESWVLQDKKRMSTKSRHIEDILAEMCQLIEEMRNEDTIGVGIGVPGLVRQPQGVVLTFPNVLSNHDVPVKEFISGKIDLPIYVENDANCFTLAETMRGAGRGHDVVVGITMGTGVGGGIVINGKVFHGSQGFAAEIGHMLLQPGQPPYETKDRRGEIEQFFSGSAMGKRCAEAKSPQEFLEGEVCEFMQPAIFREVAWMCVSLTHLLDPSIIIFGGSAGHALVQHFPKVEAEMHAWILPGTPLPLLKGAELNDAATLGAALLVERHG